MQEGDASGDAVLIGSTDRRSCRGACGDDCPELVMTQLSDRCNLQVPARRLQTFSGRRICPIGVNELSHQLRYQAD